MAGRFRWKLDGVDIDPRRIKAQVIDANLLEFYSAASNIATELEKQIAQINANSSNRGVGFYGTRYNHPLEGAEVKIEEITPGKTIEVFVPSEGKGTPGYKFNILDQGSPGSGSQDQTFPIYGGNVTAAQTLGIGNITIQEPVAWYRGPVKGFAGRKILETVKNSKRDFNGKASKAQLARFFGSSLDPGPFSWHPQEVKIRMVQRKTK